MTFPSRSFHLGWVWVVLGANPKSCPRVAPAWPPWQRQLPPSSSRQMLCDMDQVTAVRFILRQPSPVWLHFTIEELQIFPPGQKVSGCRCCPPCQARPAAPGHATVPSPAPGIAPRSSRGFRHPPEDTGLWVQLLVLHWGTWGPLAHWVQSEGLGLAGAVPALPILEVGVCLSSEMELDVPATNCGLQTSTLNTKFPLVIVKQYLYLYQYKYGLQTAVCSMV